MKKLLLLSNSTMPGTPFFTWPRPWVSQFLGDKPKNLVFIPFAAVTLSLDDYEEYVRKVFNDLDHSIFSLHRIADKKKALSDADGIVVGGGNSFALLSRMYEDDLLELVREKVARGCPYIGWSAGANLACPTIRTTNDMPIVTPPSMHALNLIPFQINPHYHELKFENQGGETRKERLMEFLVMNPQVKVIGLPEGMLLQQDNDTLTVHGTGSARLYESKQEVKDLPSGSSLNFLLKTD